MTRAVRASWERRAAARRLRTIDLFAGCSPAELARIDSLLTEVHVPAGRVLMSEGAPGRDFVIVIEGTASATRRGKALGEVDAGSFFGELSLLDEQPRTATVTAATPMRIYVLNAFEFRRLLDLSPTVACRVFDAARTRTAALSHAA